MKALRFARFGDPSVLELIHRGDGPPSPRADEVLVEIRAASINPSDVKNVAGKMHGTTLPRIPGRDFAGIITEGPSGYLGREIWGAGGDLGFTRDGSHAEYMLLPLSAVVPKPENLSFVQAAAVGVPFVTAWHGITDALGLKAGETVIIAGANGSVGAAAVQLCRWMGVRTIGFDRTAHEELPEELRPDFMITDDSLEACVEDVCRGKGVNAVFDAVGAPVFERCLPLVGVGGRYVLLSNAGSEPLVRFDVVALYRRRLTITGIDTLALDVVACSRILDHLRLGFESGVLHAPAVARTVNLKEARTAYTLQGWSGKTVIVMDEDVVVPVL